MTALDEVARQVRAAQDAELEDGSRRLAVRNRLLSRPKRRRQDQVWRSRAFVGGAFALAAAAVIGLVFVQARDGDDALVATVHGQSQDLGARLLAPAETALPVSFSDGSELVLEAAGEAKIATTDARGADVVLTRGRAHLRVVHRSRTRWTVQSGPFTVHVVGTAFSVSWQPEQGVFEIDMLEGRVLVEGPNLPERSLSGGERLRLGPGTAEEPAVLVAAETAVGADDDEAQDGASVAAGDDMAAADDTAVDGTAPAVTPSDVAEVTTPRAANRDRAVAATPAPRAAPTDTRALSDAELDQTMARAGADGLLSLADQARRGRDPRAAHICETLRARFPGSAAASVAAFHLGRLHQQDGDLVAAAGWLRTYLREQPGGHWVAEANGRLLEVLVATDDLDAARELAATYLERYPSGAHASFARSLEAH